VIRYAKPTTVDEALALLGEGPWRILAGGTDFYPAQGSKPFRDNVLDINGLAALRGITETETHWTIGARTTWTDLVRHPLPPAFDALKQDRSVRHSLASKQTLRRQYCWILIFLTVQGWMFYVRSNATSQMRS